MSVAGELGISLATRQRIAQQLNALYQQNKGLLA